MRGVASSSAATSSIASRDAYFSLSAYVRLGPCTESSDTDDVRDFLSAIGAGTAPVRSRRTRYTLGRMIVSEQLGMGMASVSETHHVDRYVKFQRYGCRCGRLRAPRDVHLGVRERTSRWSLKFQPSYPPPLPRYVQPTMQMSCFLVPHVYVPKMGALPTAMASSRRLTRYNDGGMLEGGLPCDGSKGEQNWGP